MTPTLSPTAQALVFGIPVFLFTYMLNMFFITVIYHRGLCHGALMLKSRFRGFAIEAGSWITGIDPKAWVCMHRMHHQFSDTERDPHSPHRYGVFGVFFGQLKSYEKTLAGLIRNRIQYTSVVSDLEFPVHWLNRKRLWALPYFLHAVLAVALAYWVGNAWIGGAYWLGMMSHPVQGWLVNSFAHRFGYRNFETPDDSRNNPWIAWAVMGEGYQNNHHHNPGSANFSVRAGEWDPGFLLCRMGQAAGLLEIRQ